MINNTLALYFIISMLLMFKTGNQKLQKKTINTSSRYQCNDGIVFILIITME